MSRYLKIWWIYTRGTTQIALQSRFGALFFLLGKFIRFTTLLYFLYLLISETKTLAGYSLWQILFFYATFNVIDGVPQFLLREVYRFRTQVVKGYFDYVLAQPQPTLFKALFGGSDILDIPLFLISLGFLIFSAWHLEGITLMGWIFYGLLLINAFFIALAFHIFVLGMGILTTEVDNTIMLYRDLTKMGQVPIDIYRAPISFILTFVIPIGIMISFPVKALLGILSTPFILISFVFSSVFLFLSLLFWRYSLKHYTSASS
jgi:ABC-2 type transport system permease protein